MTLVAYGVMFVLFCCELSSFLERVPTSSLLLDYEESSQLQINFDIDMYDIECRNLNVVVIDQFYKEPIKSLNKDFKLTMLAPLPPLASPAMAGRPLPQDLKKAMNRALVKHSDMTDEMRGEVMDIISGGIDKFSGPEGVNMEAATRLIKETLDKQYGFPWHCAMGQGFSFDVTAQTQTLMYLFYQGELCILVFKC